MPAFNSVSLQRATPDMAPMLGNLLELYVHDLSEVFPVELGPDGRFGYEKLPLYWAQPVRLIRRGASSLQVFESRAAHSRLFGGPAGTVRRGQPGRSELSPPARSRV